MEIENNDNQVLNGNDVDTSVDSQPQYSETEKQLYARLKKEEAEKKALKAEVDALKGVERGQPTKVNTDDERFERLELKTEGYTNDEINFILKNGGRQALEDPYVKMAIDKAREDRRNNDAIATNVSSKSAIERKYSQSDLAAMSADEMEAVLTGRKR